MKFKKKPVNIRSYEEKINDWGWKFKAFSCSEWLILTLSWCHVGLFFSEQVDGQKRRMGTSYGPLVGLNTFSQLYVGGYEEYTPELLPAGSRFQNSFQGSVFFPVFHYGLVWCLDSDRQFMMKSVFLTWIICVVTCEESEVRELIFCLFYEHL